MMMISLVSTTLLLILAGSALSKDDSSNENVSNQVVPNEFTSYEACTTTVTLGKSMSMSFYSTADMITGELTYNGIGWVGFGVSPNGKMVGSDAIIGTDSNNIKVYALTGEGLQDVIVTSDAVLVNSSFVQSNGVSTLRFTRYLQSPGGPIISIDGNGDNKFIWAHGKSNVLAEHSGKGSFSVSLVPCGQGQSSLETEVETKFNKIFKAHGVFAGLAWAILTPLAIGAAWARKLISSSTSSSKWFQIHRVLNTISYIFTLVAFFLAVYAYNQEGDAHFVGAHQAMGLSIVVLATVQILAGIFRPHIHPSTTESVVVASDEPMKREVTPMEKTKARVAWEYGHRLLGITLLACSMFQIHSGIELFEEDWSGKSLYFEVYWIGFLILLAFLFALGIYARMRK